MVEQLVHGTTTYEVDEVYVLKDRLLAGEVQTDTVVLICETSVCQDTACTVFWHSQPM